MDNHDNDEAFSVRPVWSFAPMIGDPEHASSDARTDPDRTGLGATDPSNEDGSLARRGLKPHG